MLRAHRILPLALLAAAIVAAGCGGSSGSSGSSSSSASTAATSSTAATAPTGSTATAPAAVPSAGTSEVAACKRGVGTLLRLPQGTRERLEAICEKAASGNAATKRRATEEACREVVNASPLPAGEAKQRSLAACKKAGAKRG